MVIPFIFTSAIVQYNAGIKMIEIAPSPQLQEATAISGIAVLAAKAVGYTNAGTVEFLLDDNDRFYFMEMNTRVQVEHTITETITGVDIIEEQIRVAANLPLRFKQEEIGRRGYAIQFRINAEDPQNSFLPSFGKISHYASGGQACALTRIYTGYDIPLFWIPWLPR
jgi:pyruvate carboxylase subunit A